MSSPVLDGHIIKGQIFNETHKLTLAFSLGASRSDRMGWDGQKPSTTSGAYKIHQNVIKTLAKGKKL